MNDFSQEIPQTTDLAVEDSSLHGISPIDGTHKEFGEVYLGNTGQGKFKDFANIELTEEGIDFQVWQNSAGFTGIRAKQMEGFTVEAFKIDEKTGSPTWIGADSDGKVNVVFDRGNAYKMNPAEKTWAQELIGNPGGKVGVVKITNEKTGDTDYYALGAKFTGEADKWKVTPAVAKVALSDPHLGNPTQTEIESPKE